MSVGSVLPARTRTLDARPARLREAAAVHPGAIGQVAIHHHDVGLQLGLLRELRELAE
jgi:hypothetical protein